jgi:uncharacterized SAM-binding protein YcdF (DUF218 family)
VGKEVTKVIIVLGSPNDDEGNLSDMAKSRCAQVLMEFKRNPDYKILCTGSFGEHFNKTELPHAQYVKEHLQARGIPNSVFLDFTLSRFTFEDATLSIPAFEKHQIKEAILVTSDFHMSRAKLLFTTIFPTVTFTYSASHTACNDNELRRLANHELMAIEREKRNLEVYFKRAQ